MIKYTTQAESQYHRSLSNCVDYLIVLLWSSNLDFLSFPGITVLLSLTVFMLLVAEIMPATSDSVPLIGKPRLKLKAVVMGVNYYHWEYTVEKLCSHFSSGLLLYHSVTNSKQPCRILELLATIFEKVYFCFSYLKWVVKRKFWSFCVSPFPFTYTEILYFIILFPL